MLYRRTCTAVVAASLACALLPALAPTAAAEPDCRPLTVGVGGNGEKTAGDAGYTTMMDTHLAAEAAEGRRVVNLDYPASVWPTGSYTTDESVAVGRAELQRTIAAYREECPGGNVKVIGHSLGAQVIDDPSIADEVVLYGDPRRPGGIYDAIPGVFPGTSNPDHRELAPNVTSVCHEFDVVCDAPAPWADPIRFGLGVQGYLTGNHYYAPGEADQYGAGDHFEERPSPNPNIPESLPTGLPPIDAPLPLPAWTPGPIPSLIDVAPLADAIGKPYEPTPIRAYVPEWAEAALPPEVLDHVPGPVEAFIPRFP